MKKIKGFEDYAVDKYGRVFSFKFGRILELKQSLNADGYSTISLYKNGVMATKIVHRLVAEKYIKNPENKKTVNHKNGIKTDNNVNNLEWCTQFENMRHAINTGLICTVGENCGKSKLTYGEVLIIKKLLQRDNMLQKEIGVFFGVQSTTINNINTGRTWKHIIVE